jgi:hypothetical protein
LDAEDLDVVDFDKYEKELNAENTVGNSDHHSDDKNYMGFGISLEEARSLTTEQKLVLIQELELRLQPSGRYHRRLFRSTLIIEANSFLLNKGEYQKGDSAADNDDNDGDTADISITGSKRPRRTGDASTAAESDSSHHHRDNLHSLENNENEDFDCVST